MDSRIKSVYFRSEPLWNTNRFSSALSSSFSVARIIMKKCLSFCSVIFLSSFIGNWPGTVSYTHLDVYKRQTVCWNRAVCFKNRNPFRFSVCGCCWWKYNLVDAMCNHTFQDVYKRQSIIYPKTICWITKTLGSILQILIILLLLRNSEFLN